MDWFEYSFERPADNLALDEVLLEEAESGGGEVLRFWESATPFVVLGTGQKYLDEVHFDACQRDAVPVLRRCSAGGCVMQGPGSLNFALVLDTEQRPAMRTLHDSYCAILGAVVEQLQVLGIEATVAGTSDLAVEGRKISGNAQRRKKRYFLHHGTLLYAFETRAFRRYLQEPKDQPAYRKRRGHDAFVINLPLTRSDLMLAVRAAFGAMDTARVPDGEVLARARALGTAKYSDEGWTFRR